MATLKSLAVGGNSMSRRCKGVDLSSHGHHRCFSLGLCAMASKIESKPMQSILKRLAKSFDFSIVKFSEKMILNQDITEWPKVDCLIAFYSTGYPLDKVREYVKRVKPVTLNDVEAMRYLRSRIDVFRILQQSGISVPSHIIVDHHKCKEENLDFEEHYDYIVYNGLRLNKPFIEKPADADNHNNYVYYPRNAGGGCKKLFRKNHDRSSEFYPDIHAVRRDGTYVYEEFLSTFGTDVKVYTVGQIFAHAEARKSPTLDGKVQRTEYGKEVRYPVILSESEKYTAYKIVDAFKQTVCGFDILRTTKGQSVVCDVNGWSFVKGNVKYYNDSAHIIRLFFLNQLQERYHFIPRELPEGWCSVEPEEDTLRKTFATVDEETVDPSDEELRIVVVVMRHGDRKPKRKLKFETTDPEVLEYHTQCISGTSAPSQQIVNPMREVKLKSPEELQGLLKKTKAILKRMERDDDDNMKCPDTVKRFEDLKMLQSVLERGDGYTGINRKLQIKPIAWSEEEMLNGERQLRVTRELVVAKWGGELTRVGRAQAEDLGKRLRVAMYPGDEEGGLLRLHSTFRHDLKIYTSDEGRCQVTSAAFSKGFLDLDGELTPILVQMVVRNAKAHALLDSSPIHLEPRDKCKQLLDTILNQNVDVSKSLAESLPDFDEGTLPSGVKNILKGIKFPLKAFQELQILIEKFVEALSSQIERFDSAIREQKRRSLSNIEGSMCSQLDSRIQIEKGFPISAACLRAPNRKTYSAESESSHDLITADKGLAESASLLKESNYSYDDFFSCPSCQLVILMSERLREIRHRWQQLHDEWFKVSTGRFDTTKIPDVVDNIRFDLIHHHTHIGTQALQLAFEIYKTVEPLGNFIAPAEYGITPAQKAEIGTRSIPRLLKKIIKDITFFRQNTDQGPPTTTTSTTPTAHITTSDMSRQRCCHRSTTTVVKKNSNDPVSLESGKKGIYSEAKVSDAQMVKVQIINSTTQVAMARSKSTSRLVVTPNVRETALTNHNDDQNAMGEARQQHVSSSALHSIQVSSSQIANQGGLANDDASTSLPNLTRMSSAPNYRPSSGHKYPSAQLNGEKTSEDKSQLKNDVTQDGHGKASDSSGVPSTVMRKAGEVVGSPAGGETYWLVPSTSETSKMDESGLTAEGESPTGAICKNLEPFPPSTFLSLEGTTTALKDPGQESLVSELRSVESGMNTAQTTSTAVVINSDALWGHQQPTGSAKEGGGSRNSSSQEKKSRSAAHSVGQSEAPTPTLSATEPAPSNLLAGTGVQPGPLKCLYNESSSDACIASLSAQTSTGSFDLTQISQQPQAKKTVVVSSTDQTFEPLGGIYVGFSSHGGPRRTTAEKGQKSPPPAGTVAKGLNRKLPISSNVSRTATREFIAEPSSVVSGSAAELSSAALVEPCTQVDLQETFEHEKEILEEEMVERTGAGSVNEETRDEEEISEEGEDEDDDDDDMLSHYRLKEEEAKQMGIKSPWRIVRSRYYVASASHIISLFNILMYGAGVLNDATDDLKLISKSTSSATSKETAALSVGSRVSDMIKAPSVSNVQTSALSPNVVASHPSSASYNVAKAGVDLQLCKSLSSVTSSVSQMQIGPDIRAYPLPEKAPVLLDPDAQNDAEGVTDVHYLSHIVFRVWERKNLQISDPQRFRLEIQFSSGAKDGFGGNYELLRKHTQQQQSVFQSHLDHLLGHHSASFGENCAKFQSCLTKNKEPSNSSVEMSRVPSKNSGRMLFREVTGGFSPKNTQDLDSPPTENATRRLSSNPSPSSRTSGGLGTDDQSVTSTEVPLDDSIEASSALENRSEYATRKNSITRPPLKANEIVPPYCEISPLIRLTKSCPVAALETVIVNLLKKFGSSQTSSAASAVGTTPNLKVV